MKLGLFSMPCHPPRRPHAQTFDEDLEMLILADQLGYDEAWLGEHYSSTWENIPAPDLVIAQAFALTRNIRLGTGVSCIPNHNPAQLAHRIAQLDVMGKGRFLWGVGVGAFPGDAILFEIPQDGTHRRVTHENVDAVLRIWAHGEDGFAWRSEEHPQFNFTIPNREDWRGLGFHMKPWTRPHPPIAVAGFSRSSTTLRWAGEHGWIPMSIHFVNTEDLLGHWRAYEEEALANAQTPRRSEWRIARDIYVADTDEQARQEVLAGSLAEAYRQYFFPLLKSFNMTFVWKDDPNMRDEDITVEHVLNKPRGIVGSPDTVARRLRELYNEVGGFGGLLMLCYDWEGENGPRWRRSMELLAKEVLPQLADLTGEATDGPVGAHASSGPGQTGAVGQK
jgi:alkanesulfonate monooxygenase SsuD/methylene tetrahydromethanopterin reductase-like flavin-dependent oxidoreductase (luciferase family)